MTESFVVTVIPTYNEAEFIERSLRSFINQTFPANCHVIHCVDGGSNDGTREIISSLSKESSESGGPEVVLLDNPDKFVAQARNISLQNLPENASHILEMIGHSWVPKDHIEKRLNDFDDLVSTLGVDGKKVAGVGTLTKPSDQPLGLVGSWIEATLQNPLASGKGQFAQFTGRSPTNVPPFTLYRRDALEEVGGWNPEFITTQDSELNMRLISNGWTLWRSDISYCHMAKRTTMLGWLRFGHRYGFWRMKHLLKEPKRASPLEFLPWVGLLMTLLLCSQETILGGYPAWQIPLATYGVVLLLHGILETIAHRQISLIFGLPVMLVLLHTMFSIGLLDGLIRKGKAPRDRIR